MSYDARQQTGDQGVSIAALAIQRLGWIFREQNKADHGIDAHLEIVKDGNHTGKLVGLQIKSGSSYLKAFEGNEFVFRGKGKHLEYWSDHCLPILLLLVDTETEDVYWQVVDKTKVHQTKDGWKLGVPRKNLLTEEARVSIEMVAEGSPADRRLRRLRLDLDLMRFLRQNPYNSLFLEAVTWQNKLLPRTEMKLLSRDAEGEEELIQDYGFQFGWSLTSLLNHLFPWVEVSIDVDHYFYCEDVDTPRGDGSELRPYEDNGETASWRLELVLNELGRSFLVVSDFLDSE